MKGGDQMLQIIRVRVQIGLLTLKDEDVLSDAIEYAGLINNDHNKIEQSRDIAMCLHFPNKYSTENDENMYFKEHPIKYT